MHLDLLPLLCGPVLLKCSSLLPSPKVIIGTWALVLVYNCSIFGPASQSLLYIHQTHLLYFICQLSVCLKAYVCAWLWYWSHIFVWWKSGKWQGFFVEFIVLLDFIIYLYPKQPSADWRCAWKRQNSLNPIQLFTNKIVFFSILNRIGASFIVCLFLNKWSFKFFPLVNQAGFSSNVGLFWSHWLNLPASQPEVMFDFYFLLQGPNRNTENISRFMAHCGTINNVRCLQKTWN